MGIVAVCMFVAILCITSVSDDFDFLSIKGYRQQFKMIVKFKHTCLKIADNFLFHVDACEWSRIFDAHYLELYRIFR